MLLVSLNLSRLFWYSLPTKLRPSTLSSLATFSRDHGGRWVSSNECAQPLHPPPCLVPWTSFKSKIPFMGGLPSPWLLLPLATNTTAVAGVKKWCPPQLPLCKKCACLQCVSLQSVSRCRRPSLISLGRPVCVCMCARSHWLKHDDSEERPHVAPSLAPCLCESAMGGAPLISQLLSEVAGSQHCGPQLREHDK